MGKRSLRDLLTARLENGFVRASSTTASRWAEQFRKMRDGNWSFKNYPWLREMHDSDAPLNVGQKAAQMGYTETMLNITLYTIDILGQDVLYVLPNNKPDAADFSAARFAPALELSPHLQDLFTDTDNVGHKRAGSANLYVRGSQSRPGLKSIPVTTVIMDEVAEFCQENIPLAMERTSGQLHKLIWMVSTPTIEGKGISNYYNQSDKRHFVFPCPCCSEYTELLYPESLVVTAESLDDERIADTHLICHKCKNKLDHRSKAEWLAKGIWEPQVRGGDWRGYTISQLYSPTIEPRNIATSVILSRLNPADEVELYNSKLGLSHEIKGARVTEEEINKAIMDGPKHHNTRNIMENGVYTMGVDVGKWLHVCIMKWLLPKKASLDPCLMSKGVVTYFCTLKDFESLYDLITDSPKNMQIVIDSQPERRAATSLYRRFYGRVKLCQFANGVSGRSITVPKDPDPLINESVISVDRTSWLDLTIGRFKNGTVYLPVDLNVEYRNHLTAVVKTYGKDRNGNAVAKYETKDNTPDHYTFAQTYAEVAFGNLMANAGQVRNITG